MMKLAICDDNVQFAEMLAKKIENITQSIDEVTIDLFSNGNELLNSNIDFTILFLDIELENESGLEIAANLRRKKSNCIIIFVSSYIQYAPLGYNVKAFAYLLKSTIDDSLEFTLVDAFKTIDFENRTISFADGHAIKEIYLKDILFIESENKYIRIYTVDKSIFRTRMSSKDTYESLKYFGFEKIQKSYIINFRHVSLLKNYVAYINDTPYQLKISPKLWKGVLSNYINYRGNIV